MANKETPERRNHLDFLYQLHTDGIPIGEENIALLVKHGFIDGEEALPEVQYHHPKKEHIYHQGLKSAAERMSDKHVDVLTEEGAGSSVVTEEEYANQSIEFEGGRKITKEDWLPASKMEHTKEFIDWIDSMLFRGFQNKTYYKKFHLYCQQADEWLSDNESIADFDDPQDRQDYEDQEMLRMDENTYYFHNKYLKLKEGDINTGARDYKATPAHKVMLYLLDCGYSLYIGKPRQIAATSTMAGYAVKKILCNRNFFLKFVTQDKIKGEEIFEDKIKHSYSELPEWMKESVRNDRDNLFVLGYKEEKGDREGVNSKIQVEAPTITAISGGSPQLSFIDEAGNINILTQIIEDANPTMYWMNPATGKIEMKRQIVVWGTGGEMEKGGKAFEREFMAAVKRWQERDFTSGIIPIFFDWTTRPGITREFYENKKREFFSKTGPDAEGSKVKFYQQYPACIEDMFLTSSKTLVSQEYINEALERIRTYINKISPAARPQYGYLEPIYGDEPAPENSDLPFNITGVNFIPTEDADPRATTIILHHPKKGWKNRYFEGTDPIASDNGTSKMASAIWDNHYKTVSALVNFRSPNYKEAFLQSALLGMYYDVERGKGVKEMLECNIGLAYREYKDSRGWFDSLVFNTELPQYLQTQSGNLIGIDNRGHRNKLIIDKMFELIQAFGGKIYIEEFFIQLKTFVCTVNKKGNESWGPMDRRYYHDDILFAVVFAYICSLCYSHLIPTKIEDEEKKKSAIRYETYYDKDCNLHRVPVRRRR